MKNIITIFKKEMLDTLRDRRTLIAMVVAPLLIIPVIMAVTSSIQSSQTESAKEKHLKIAIESNDNGAELVKRFETRKDVTVVKDIDPKDFNQLIREDSLDIALVINEGFDDAVASNKRGWVGMYYNSTGDRIIRERIESTIDRYNDQILRERLKELGTTSAMIEPIKTQETDVYTKTESIGKAVGGFLPYIFVLFALMGGMYPAIDLFTGEKERGTIETILTVPVNRIEILIGKMLVVIIAGVVSAVLTLIGMYAAMRLSGDVPEELLNVVSQVLKPSVIALVIFMMIPLTTFFAGVMIPAAIYAKSFKEAQSLIQPMTMVVILPLILGMMPFVKLNFMTALIPVLNVALASKEIIAGTIDYSLLAVVFLSLFAFAALGIIMCVRWFGKEGNVLRV